MENWPEMPDSVAFALLLLIMENGKMRATNQPIAAEVLDLYALCLAAARGERDVSHGGEVVH